MRMMSLILPTLTSSWKIAIPSFELGCGTANHKWIDSWSTRVITSASEASGSLSLMIVRDIFRDVMDRIAKVELQLYAHHGDEPHIQPRICGNDGELSIVSVTILK